MAKIKAEYENSMKIFEINAEEERKQNRLSYEDYIKEKNRIENFIKEKEERIKKEIALNRQQSEINIREIKKKAKERLDKLNEQNKKELEELERQYQNGVDQNENIIRKLLEQYQKDARNIFASY